MDKKEVPKPAVVPDWLAGVREEYAARVHQYEQKLGVPWAQLAPKATPAIVIEYRWLNDREGLLEEETKFYRVPRSEFLADCYFYYLADEDKRQEPSYSAAVTWWKFLSLIGEGKGDWTSDLGSRIEAPLATDWVVNGYRCYPLPFSYYRACDWCDCRLRGRLWVNGICKRCDAAISSRTRAKAAQ